MKYLIPAFVFLHIQACGGDSNPFAPLTDTDPSGSTQQTDSNTMQESIANPVVMPVPQSDVVTAPQPEAPMVADPVVEPEPFIAPEPIAYVERVMWCTDDAWSDSRQIGFISDGSLQDPDGTHSFWDSDGYHYINLYDQNWNAHGLSRVTDSYYDSWPVACANNKPEASTEQIIEQTNEMRFEDYYGQAWACEQFGLQEGGSKSILTFNQDGTGAMSFKSGITGADVVTEFSWVFSDGAPVKIEATFASFFIDAENMLLTTGVPDNSLDHEYRCYAPDR